MLLLTILACKNAYLYLDNDSQIPKVSKLKKSYQFDTNLVMHPWLNENSSSTVELELPITGFELTFQSCIVKNTYKI